MPCSIERLFFVLNKCKGSQKCNAGRYISEKCRLLAISVEDMSSGFLHDLTKNLSHSVSTHPPPFNPTTVSPPPPIHKSTLYKMFSDTQKQI